ncbi:hypothetical protein SIID45300_01641 [Candidatus Magnetaquicoccaceae bacterium FCR-1]|uniref:FtsK domain-containing protein n=1 Tax=Candidatus Magnetaquiglobus chichijimensis TaxID=3141448 RepID=A0ABQ0C8W0_9PROT
MILQSGQRLQLTQLVDPNVPFVIGMRFEATNLSVDCLCLGTDEQNRVHDDRYMIFFNQPVSPCGGIALAVPTASQDGFEINLSALPDAIASLVFAASVEAPKNFSNIASIDIFLIQGDSITGQLTLPGNLFTHGERAILFLKIYRKENSWRLNAIGQGFSEGMQALVSHFNIAVHDPDDIVPPPHPPLSLLPPDDTPEPDDDPNQITQLTDSITRTLNDFHVRGHLVGVDSGPILMTFKWSPAPGVRLSRVTTLEPELSLALTCPGLRIDPLFHHGVIGIEIPKPKRSTIPLRRILASRHARETPEPLLIPLGVDTLGEPILENLELLPHLLIAGTTRSGKSVMLHGILCGVMLRARLTEARILLIDPKRNEFSLYEGTPHLLGPIVTEVRQARNSLHWLTGEMEARYQAMNGIGVRNLQGWQDLYRDPLRNPEQEVTPAPPPLLLVVIDELADLMLQSGKAVEEPLVRLAQMGRAAGIHLVLATQRPSRDVMTGLIKSNIPARLAFKVTSKMDSRIILDVGGAENLLGQGDGLFIAPGQELRRIQAPMVSEKQVQGVIRFLKNTQPFIPDARLVDSLTTG